MRPTLSKVVITLGSEHRTSHNLLDHSDYLELGDVVGVVSPHRLDFVWDDYDSCQFDPGSLAVLDDAVEAAGPIPPLVCRVGGNDEPSAGSRPEVYRAHGLVGDDSFQDAEGRVDPTCEVGKRLVFAVFYGVETGSADFAEDALLEKDGGAV